MINLPEGRVVMIDVDDTLIKWDAESHEKQRLGIPIRYNESNEYIVPIQRHIDELKRHAIRGHQIIVWSQGGADWAKAAVEALGLEAYVTLTMAKPSWYYDDLTPGEFMGENRFIKDE